MKKDNDIMSETSLGQQGIIYPGSHRSLLRKTSTAAMQILLLAQKTAIRFCARARVQGAVPVGVN